MRYDTIYLRETCLDFDDTFGIADVNIVTWNTFNEHILITVDRLDYGAPLYLPFKYKDIPVKAELHIIRDNYCRELTNIYNLPNSNVLTLDDDLCKDVISIIQEEITDYPVYLPFRYKESNLLLHDEAYDIVWGN